jgi:ATP-binding cassette subfamily C (CFTR/MRP) protein 1
MTEKLQEAFRRRVERGEKNPLLWSLHETFKFEFWLGGICQLFASIFQVMSPFTLRYLIEFAQEAYYAEELGVPAPPIGRGIGLVLGITAMQVFQSLGTNQFIYHGMMIGGQCRAVLISVIFEKAMTISGRAKAGGRALTDTTAPPENDEEGKDKAKKSFFQKMMNKGDKPAPKAQESKGSGVSGDGTGWGSGKSLSLMAVDSYRIDQASGMFHMVWTSPIAMLITLVVLIIELTYSALAGFALLVIGLPVLTMAVKALFVRRKAINKITDQRVSLTQEILQAVRFVKFFGWETAFLERLGDIRKREIHAIQILLAIRNAINAVSMSMPIFASMLAFITYSQSGNGLNPANVFSSLALFNSLRMPLNLLPLVIGQVVDAWSSMGRIEEYLSCEDQEDEAVWDKTAKHAVEMKNASYTWERTATQEEGTVKIPGQMQSKGEIKEAKKVKKQAIKDEKKAAKDGLGETTPDSASTLIENREPFKLHDLDFNIARDELVAVIGNVGSGKSSLLAALAGDMRRTSGEVTLGADRAFCPQYAWIQNASVKENILFGKDMNQAWYQSVIDACALAPDLEMLPNGDLTEIGERGITVSGGQKQRLNIARAIYFNADIIIMDDPLSAVDAHVGRHIFDNAICGLLKGKCRILATHQLWVLSRCDRIIWLDEGKVLAVDTFNNLMASNSAFQHLMETTAVEDKQEDEAHVNDDEVEGEKKETKKKRKGVALMQAEERAVKSVSWSVYGAYIRASGSIFNLFLVLVLLLMSQASNIVTSLWLSWWTSNKWGYSTGIYIGVYAAMGFLQALFMFLFSLALTLLGTVSSKTMLNRAITRALRAPMSFFDTTPLGRITNRFSRDVDTMDNNLTDAISMYFLTLGMIISVFVLIIAYFPYVSAPVPP